VGNWSWGLDLLSLQRVVEGATIDNFSKKIMQVLIDKAAC